MQEYLHDIAMEMQDELYRECMNDEEMSIKKDTLQSVGNLEKIYGNYYIENF